MPLPLTVSRSSKIQIGFTFLVPAYPGCPGKEAVKWLLLLLSLLPFPALVSKIRRLADSMIDVVVEVESLLVSVIMRIC